MAKDNGTEQLSERQKLLSKNDSVKGGIRQFSDQEILELEQKATTTLTKDDKKDAKFIKELDKVEDTPNTENKKSKK